MERFPCRRSLCQVSPTPTEQMMIIIIIMMKEKNREDNPVTVTFSFHQYKPGLPVYSEKYLLQSWWCSLKACHFGGEKKKRNPILLPRLSSNSCTPNVAKFEQWQNWTKNMFLNVEIIIITLWSNHLLSLFCKPNWSLVNIFFFCKFRIYDEFPSWKTNSFIIFCNHRYENWFIFCNLY